MQRQRRHTLVIFVLITAALLLPHCAPQIVTVTVTTPPEIVVVTATPGPSPLATPDPAPPKTLTVCLVGEPDTLYLYGGSRIGATQHVMEALYDGPIDYVDYIYRPVILEKVPSLADGDAITRTVRVRRGSRVLSADGSVVPLEEGVWVRPAGCYADECAVEFTGTPLLMERMEVTFVLREGVTWADGEPVTTEDSRFAYHVASDSSTPGYRYLAERTFHYIVQDERQVKWVGLPGFRDSTYFMNFFPPLPRHQLEDRSPSQLLQADETRRQPLGWGPFVVEEWASGDHLTLTRNPSYFRASEGLPHLERVVFRFASDASDVLARLLSGECDVGTHDADFELSMPLLMQAEQYGLLRVVSTMGNGWEHIDFGIVPAPEYQRPDFFADVLVRQAIIQCIDRQAIVDEVTYGRSVVPDSYLPTNHPLYAGVYLMHWGYNPEAGRALLEKVGWIDEDEDGVRKARGVAGVPAGAEFQVSLLTSSDSAASQHIARIIKAHLADCSIQVGIQALPSWQLFADGPEGPLFGRQFDMAGSAWWFDFTPLCGHYVSAAVPENGYWYGDNVTGYSNPIYDEICQAALQALPGTPAYEEYHRQAQIIFSEELPAIPLFMWLRVSVIRPNVLNFTLDSTARSELWNIELLDVE
ncbi:MAG TPA: peptide ABC transporter substrate-binding protein [Chloroflexi bacterium]|nr:peptide ABC transporter substrate-binding protein [Chloroflexota bacterium]